MTRVLKLLFIAVLVALASSALAVHAFAQEDSDTDIPPPYAGMQNLFSWDDATAQEQGEEFYRRLCLSCHGVAGNTISASDFSTVDFSNDLDSKPDYYFWKISEGEPDSGMPAYKSSLTEEQRWQVIVYLWSLSGAVSPETTPPTVEPPVVVGNLSLLLITADQAQSGEPIFLTTVLRDNQGKPVPGARVKYFIKTDFFINDSMEIGEILTDDEGSAVLEYIPRQSGEIEVGARYETLETTKKVNLTPADKPFYETEVGLDAWSLGKESFFILPIFGEQDDSNSAPNTVLRLPTGVLVWGTPLLLTVLAIWATCFYVGYQLYRIPITQEIEGINTKLVPTIILTVITALGILLSLMLITGPYSR